MTTTNDVACDIIELALFEVDEALRKVTRDEGVTHDDVVNMLLDVRATLDRYYVVPSSRGVDPLERHESSS